MPHQTTTTKSPFQEDPSPSPSSSPPKPKPTFILLHGAFHPPTIYSPLSTLLLKAGYPVLCPSLPSTFPTSTSPSSFSGLIAGTALKDLDKESQSRLQKGKGGGGGGVIRLIYIASFIVPEGFQHTPYGTRENMVPQMMTDFDKGIITVPSDIETLRTIFYQDISSDETIAELAKQLRPQSLASFWGTTTYAAWRVIPTTYIACMADLEYTVAGFGKLVSAAMASGNHRIDNIIEVDAGHFPFITRPEWMAQTLIKEANR
ncbi:alpha/beta-hydrolase [Poronia punctata]|nr:alpha/beta-hydrolase [Poronia punctata]